MKQVSTRQFYYFLVLATVALKFLFLPTIIASECGSNGFIAIFLTLALDVGMLSIYLYIQNKVPDMNFLQILDKLFGKIISRIILILFFFLFIIKGFSIFQSLYVFLLDTLYQELNWLTYTIPMLFVIAFVCSRKLNVIARMIEASFFIIAFCLLASFFIGSLKADISNLLPIMENGFVDIQGMYKYLLWFGDYIVLIMLFGDVKREKRFYLKVYLWEIGAVLFVTAFYVVFYCLYGNGAVVHNNAVSDVIQVLPLSADIGRLDWVIVLVWIYAIFVALILLIYLSSQCFDWVIASPSKWIGISVSIALLIASILIFNYDIAKIIVFDAQYAKYLAIATQYVVPIFMLIFSFRLNKKGDKKL